VCFAVAFTLALSPQTTPLQLHNGVAQLVRESEIPPRDSDYRTSQTTCIGGGIDQICNFYSGL
jgi:hypothetical protein